jgi:hypothetical protein
MPLTQPFQSRATAMRGDFVRLFCTFMRDGVLYDPTAQPQVRIVTNDYVQESTSSSSETNPVGISSSSSEGDDPTTGHGPFYAVRMYTGMWYVDWFVPIDAPLGDYFDIWYFQLGSQEAMEKKTFNFEVHSADAYVNFESNPIVITTGRVAVTLINAMKTNLIAEACDIPVYWEQGVKIGNNKLNFAYKNWIKEQPTLLRVNNKISEIWTPDFNGGAIIHRPIDPEDMFYAHYHFSYFSDEDLLSFLNEGMWMMNATPPATQAYGNLASIPFNWRAGVILYASMQALRRIIFGFTFQERAIIFGEKPEDAQRFIDNCKTLYSDYNTMWAEIRKDIKKALPAISIQITPEYTMPGGRCLSSTTCIICKIDGIQYYKTISELYQTSTEKQISVLSLSKNGMTFAPVSKIWKSGRKMTFVLAANGKSLRVSKEHLVFMPDSQDYKPVFMLHKGDKVLTVDGGEKIVARLDYDPLPYAEEDVYDMEVPSSGNMVSNGIVTHNSRWFRYLYHSGV